MVVTIERVVRATSLKRRGESVRGSVLGALDHNAVLESFDNDRPGRNPTLKRVSLSNQYSDVEEHTYVHTYILRILN